MGLAENMAEELPRIDVEAGAGSGPRQAEPAANESLLRIENEPEVRARFGDFFTDHLLRRIGGQLRIRSDVGRGTVVICSFAST